MQDSGHTPEWNGPTVERVMRNGKRIYVSAFKAWLVEQALRPMAAARARAGTADERRIDMGRLLLAGWRAGTVPAALTGRLRRDGGKGYVSRRSAQVFPQPVLADGRLLDAALGPGFAVIGEPAAHREREPRQWLSL